jgi:hypothetical protein
MPKPNVAVVQGSYSATSISVTACEHGHVFVRLHDRVGNVFAFGCVDPGTAMMLDGQLRQAIDGAGGFRCDTLH